ncbi:hypothetical protein [Amycolatopsis sp. NPDC003676]
MIWVHVEKIVLNTETHRVKYQNAARDEQDPYRYAEVCGRVILQVTPERQTFIDQKKGVAD